MPNECINAFELGSRPRKFLSISISSIVEAFSRIFFLYLTPVFVSIIPFFLNTHLLNVWGTILLCAGFLSCQGFTFPNTSALSLAPFSKSAGSASALLGSVQMAIGALTSAAVSFFNDGTAVPMTAVMASCAVVSFLIVFAGGKVIRQRATTIQVQEEAAEMIVTS